MIFQKEESELQHNPDDHDRYNNLKASNLDERHSAHLSALKHQVRGHGVKSQKPLLR
uniref:Uncharacterized protein n=1 Tax=Amphimedon queenslandica TaxID=400682 RepID=A0A1X7V8H7_AMPQE